jgi:hypothetical protein
VSDVNGFEKESEDGKRALLAGRGFRRGSSVGKRVQVESEVECEVAAGHSPAATLENFQDRPSSSVFFLAILSPFPFPTLLVLPYV